MNDTQISQNASDSRFSSFKTLLAVGLLFVLLVSLYAWNHQQFETLKSQHDEEIHQVLKQSSDKTNAMLSMVQSVQTDLLDLRQNIQNPQSLASSVPNIVLHTSLAYYSVAQFQWAEQHHPAAARQTLNQLQQWLNQLPAASINSSIQALVSQDLQELPSVEGVEGDPLMMLQQLQDAMGRQPLADLRLSRQAPKVQLPSIGTDQNIWKKILNRSWQAMRPLVSIRHSAKENSQWIPLSDSQWLQQNLMMELQKAQLAGLTHQNTLMRSSVQRCQEWLRQGLEPCSEQQQWLAVLDSIQRSLPPPGTAQTAVIPLSNSIKQLLQWMALNSHTE